MEKVKEERQMNRQFSKLEITAILGLSLFVGALFVWLTNNSYETKVNGVAFAKRDTEIEGVVDRTLPVKGSVKIWFKNGSKVLVHAGHNYSYRDNFITDLLQKGDSLAKHSGSDTIFIHRANKVYFFLLNKDINLK